MLLRQRNIIKELYRSE